MTRALVAGWFSFDGMGATAGVVLAAGVAKAWLTVAGREVLVAVVPPFVGDVFLDAVDPATIDELVFVCGPFGNGWPVTDMLWKFKGVRLLGLDLSMLQPLAEWNPFDLLVERESDRRSHPDLALASQQSRVPVIGLVEVHPQTEYGDRARHAEVGRVIREALAGTPGAVIPIDTRLDVNAGGLRTAAEVESLIARCDVVVTTRLHGLVLALKNGVPAVAVDPISGGAKVSRQAAQLGWPVLFTPESVSPDAVAQAVSQCLGGEYSEPLRESLRNAQQGLAEAKAEFLSAIGA